MSSKTDKIPSAPTGIKLHELAKEMGVPSKALLEKAVELGIKNVRSHASTLTLGQADRLRAKMGGVKHLQAELEESKTRFMTPKKKTGVSSKGGSARFHPTIEHAEPSVSAEAGVEESPMPGATATATSTTTAGTATEELELTRPLAVPEITHEMPAAAPSSPAHISIEKAAEETLADANAVAVSPETATREETPRFGVVAHVPSHPEELAPKISAQQVAPVSESAATPESIGEVSAPVPVTAVPAHVSAQTGTTQGMSQAAGPAELPSRAAPVKRVLSGPEVTPPIQRGQRIDPRFGVVVPAPPPPEVKPQPAPKAPMTQRGKPVQVETKPLDDFKPQVSYPSLPENFRSDDEERSKAVGRATAVRRVPGRAVPGLKGFSTGPRRGQALLRGDDERFRGARRPKQRIEPKPTVKREGPAEVTSPVTIKALCEALGIKSNDLIRKFMEQGKIVKINDVLLDSDAELYALEFDPLKFGVTIKKARDVEEELLRRADVADKPENVRPRAPVVTIMGHVDHGKTSLLDYIRNAKVAAGEAGGITQHIGAYKVQHTKGEVAFIDTPGHRAFTEMRARGANVTDVVVLVVAATDGMMPQTEEAISHARQAGKKIVVAMNKIDLPEANPDRVKGQLAAKELFVEGYGGDVGCVEVSAKTGQGVDDLLDRILLEAEILELKANPNKPAVGSVVEAHKDQGRGIVCTLLVQEGTLNQGDIIICGHAYGSVRQIFSDTGKLLKTAGPSTPVLVTGLNDVPLSGERFHVLDSIKHAAEIAEQRAMRMRQEGLVKRTHVTLETLSDMLKLGAVASLKLVLKVDVQGSLAPLRNELGELSRPDAKIDILHDGVGAINETDVLLADASDAIVIGFSVTADPGARRLAEERSVDIRIYSIIYEVVDEVRRALEGMLKPIEREVIQAHATVRQTFKISKIGTIAGCFVTDGTLLRNSGVRLIRDGKPVWSGKLASLKRVKDDAKEVRSGFECGIKLDGYDDIKQGDTLEGFATEQVKRTLDAK